MAFSPKSAPLSDLTCHMAVDMTSSPSSSLKASVTKTSLSFLALKEAKQVEASRILGCSSYIPTFDVRPWFVGTRLTKCLLINQSSIHLLGSYSSSAYGTLAQKSTSYFLSVKRAYLTNGGAILLIIGHPPHNRTSVHAVVARQDASFWRVHQFHLGGHTLSPSSANDLQRSAQPLRSGPETLGRL